MLINKSSLVHIYIKTTVATLFHSSFKAIRKNYDMFHVAPIFQTKIWLVSTSGNNSSTYPT